MYSPFDGARGTRDSEERLATEAGGCPLRGNLKYRSRVRRASAGYAVELPLDKRHKVRPVPVYATGKIVNLGNVPWRRILRQLEYDATAPVRARGEPSAGRTVKVASLIETHTRRRGAEVAT